jgi:hypothetical protein
MHSTAGGNLSLWRRLCLGPLQHITTVHRAERFWLVATLQTRMVRISSELRTVVTDILRSFFHNQMPRFPWYLETERLVTYTHLLTTWVSSHLFRCYTGYSENFCSVEIISKNTFHQNSSFLWTQHHFSFNVMPTVNNCHKSVLPTLTENYHVSSLCML